MKLLTIRSISFAAATLAMAASANALTIDWSGLQGTSTIAFSQSAISLFKANGGRVNALGNTTAVLPAGSPATAAAWTFVLPITSITITPTLKIGSGQASGSALDIVRKVADEDGNVLTSGIVLANFILDYTNKKVLADSTTHGAATLPKFAVFNFNVATPLALKYKFPLSITGHEVLDKLALTSPAVDLFATSLGLSGDAVLALVAGTDFGTLTQDIAVMVRKPAASKTPYVPAP
ncbi:hypothetical protein [Aquabacterium sp.]|uniref:hypothetical protein n=1 Tax=Aquabacterium sp. TaxID=1872578 RepID=UPI0019C75856|nr:hypothetical protein [Aquabacterium sp.]MBC7699577.1 hypothetical protein [Aquabacterium sp.]